VPTRIPEVLAVLITQVVVKVVVLVAFADDVASSVVLVAETVVLVEVIITFVVEVVSTVVEEVILSVVVYSAVDRNG
jgi:hypothetical protein